jgi:L-ascorbate metabolism protein UlaG (beta-lactamase superfamily)
MKNLEVQFISHACLKIKGSFGTMVCDPWILNEPVFNLSTWKFPPARIKPEDVVKDCDILLITHSHEDHFHIPSLDFFPRDTPILLSNFDRHASLRAHSIEIALSKMGFSNITRMKSWEVIHLDEHNELMCVPSAYSRDQDWENSGFVLQSPDCPILNLNDNLNDQSLCEEINEKYPNIDIGFIQTGGVTMYPGCFKMTPEEMKVEASKRKVAFRDQKRMLDFIAPKRIAPFAGDFCWLADQYFHQNWANRTTPILMQEMLDNDYVELNPEMVLMQPGDTWTIDGHIENGRRVDWDNYLSEIAKVKGILQPKLDSLSDYIESASTLNLLERSVQHMDLVQTFITKDYIDFTARFRISIEGENSNFSFVTKADPVNKFQVDWQDNDPVPQTLHVTEKVWASILEGNLMWNIIQWVGIAEQTEFTRDMGRFWFWMEYHIDLNSKNIQAIITDRLWPDVKEKIRPQHGTFPFDNEWERIESFYEE